MAFSEVKMFLGVPMGTILQWLAEVLGFPEALRGDKRRWDEAAIKRWAEEHWWPGDTRAVFWALLGRGEPAYEVERPTE